MKQETEEEDFSPRTLSMIASLEDSEESRTLVAQLKAARYLLAYRYMWCLCHAVTQGFVIVGACMFMIGFSQCLLLMHDMTLGSNILGKQLKEAAPTSDHVKREVTTPEVGATAVKAPFPPEPPLPPAIPPAVPKEPTLRPKEPDYPPPGWVAPTEPKAPGPSPEDLMRQQRLLAEQMYEAARQEGPVMPRMPIFTGPTAPDMTNVWLQQQQDIMKQQQTSFLIKQEQARMDFLTEQQKQFEMQQQAVLTQMQQQGCMPGPAASTSFLSVGGPMQEAMSLQEERRRDFMVEQERLRQQQQREEERMEQQRMEQEQQLRHQRELERMEEQRMEQERLQQEQDAAARAEEEARLLQEEEEVRRNSEESRMLAQELYDLESKAEKLRNQMIAKSSQSKAPGYPRAYVIPANWPKEVPLPPIPPPVPTMVPQPRTPPIPPQPTRSRSPRGSNTSLSERVRQVAKEQLAPGAAKAKEYLMQQVQQMQQAQTAAATEQQVQHMQQAQTAAATEPEDARPPKRHKDDGVPPQPKAMPRLPTMPPKPKHSSAKPQPETPKQPPGSPAPAVGVRLACTQHALLMCA